MSELKLTKKLERPVRFAFWGAEEAGLLGSEHYVAALSDANRAKIYANLNFDMLGSPNYVRFVYDGDGSNGGESGPPGSAQIEGIFNGLLRRQGPRVGADGLRRTFGLRTVHRRGHSRRWPVQRRRRHQDARGGGDIRRHGRCSL